MRHFRLCRLFCFPSLHEGLPNALIEGIASGIPVFAADCPYGPRSILAGEDEQPPRSNSLPLVLKHGTLLPLLSAAGSPAIWQSAIVAELARPARRKTISECRDAIARFDLEETGKAWIALIEQAAQQKPQLWCRSNFMNSPDDRKGHQ
jgi:N-acetylgalactosamine-N,N'-diacetylbacillosaminyl-diphospho-undecaprenol 4-alpha-N-acetylgalactosaminyltransferase